MRHADDECSRGFSDKCQNCELDVETLDFTCDCETAPGHDVFETSTINLGKS